jgi:outer membrane protein assembly factor BamA
MVRLLKPIVLFVLLGCYPVCIWSQHPSKMEKHEVAAIEFIGDSVFPALQLESIINTRTTNWFERTLNGVNSNWGSPTQYIDERVLGEDTLRIFAFYRDRGYFDAHASYSIHEIPPTPEVESILEHNRFLPASKQVPYVIKDTVVFRVTEGKPYFVEGFTFDGFEHLPMDLQNKVTENIGIKQKSQYSKLPLQLETYRVQQILAENGYPFGKLVYTLVEPDTLRKTVTISLKFNTGPRIKVGGAKIIYDTAYPGFVEESVVKRQIRLDSGSWYKNSDLITTERDLAKLNTFQYQSVSLDTSEFNDVADSLRDGLILPMVITLRMRKSLEFTPGVYAGENSFYQAIFGIEASLSERNLFHSADNLTFHASYQLLPVWSSEKRWSVGGQLLLPYIGLDNVPFILSTNFSYAWIFNEYLEKIYSASLSINVSSSGLTPPRKSWIPTLSYQYVQREYYDPSLKPKGNSSFIVPPQSNLIFSSDLSLDWKNDERNPSNGSYINWSSQFGPPILLSASSPSSSFLKNTIQFKTFFELGAIEERSVLGLRIFAGHTWLFYPDDPNRDLLIENRYFEGGSNSMRGWSARSLLISNDNTPGHPFFGGYRALEMNAEWRYALFQYPIEITAMQKFLSSVRLALFLDAGNVWDKNVLFSQTYITDMAVAGGAGIHYNTAFGAIRFEFGFKLYDPYPNPFPPGTKGEEKTTDKILATPPHSTSGVWLWNRKDYLIGDIYHFEFGIGQSF